MSLLGGNPITSFGVTGGQFGAFERNLLNYANGTTGQFGAIGSNAYALGGAHEAGKIGTDFFKFGGDSIFGFKGLSSAFNGLIGLQSIASLF